MKASQVNRNQQDYFRVDLAQVCSSTGSAAP